MQIEEAKKILDDMRTWDCTLPNRIQTEAIDTVLNELEKKDKVINEIEDLCIRKSDEEGQEYGGVIIWNFANKIMDIIKKERTNK